MIALNGEVVRDEAHRYWLMTGAQPRELVGVSAVLRDAQFTDDRFFTAESRDRGHLVHEITEAIDAQEPRWHGWAIGDDEIANYGASYELLIAEHRPRWFLTETIVYDPILGYAGTLDRFGLLNADTLATADFKSGKTMPGHGPQTAAYKRCIPDTWIDLLIAAGRLDPALGAQLRERKLLHRRYTIELQRDGSRAPFVPHAKPDDQIAFMSALNCYHWREKHVRNCHASAIAV